MPEQYVGEIRMFGGDYAPRGWAFCDGRSLSVSQFELLFSVLGNTYGGDGVDEFKLPDLRGRVAVHRGEGPGLVQNYAIGEKAGTELASINEEHMPRHTHSFQASKGPGTSASPQNAVIGSPPAVSLFKGREAPETKLPPAMVEPVGGGQPHANRMPFLAITYIISLDGILPAGGHG